VADWLAAGGIRYEHRSGAYGSVDFAYRGFAYVTDVNDTTTAPYAIFGARAGWRRTLDVGCAQLEFDAAVGVKNLFDKEYELRHSATLYVPGAPREVFAEVGFGVEF
jgi:outer membrane receptor protein involved in Fe transport